MNIIVKYVIHMSSVDLSIVANATAVPLDLTIIAGT